MITQTGEVFHFATPEETSIKMEELVKWIKAWLEKPKKEQLKSLVPFLVELHQRFIHIHPFDDGNGRVVRLLLAYVLIRLDFLPLVLSNREKYIKAIQFADAGNTNQLEQLFLENMTFMLKQGIFAKNNKVNLNQGVEGETASLADKDSRLRGNDKLRKNDSGGSNDKKNIGNDDPPTFREDERSQIPALQLLQNMGWTYLEPEEALNSRKNNIQNVLLEDILEEQLKKN